MAASVVVGVLWQELAAAFGPYVLAASIVTMYLTVVRLDVRVLGGWLRRPMLPAAIAVWTLLAVPLLVLSAVRWADAPPALAAALVVIAATPPIMSVGAYCAFLGTAAELLIVAVLPATVLSIVTLPAFAAAIGVAGVTPGGLVLTLLAIVGIALGGAALTRRFISFERIERNAAWLDAAMVLVIIVIGAGVTDGLRAVIAARPSVVFEYFLGTLVLNALLQTLTWCVFAGRGARLAASAALAGGCRNMALLIGVLAGKVEPDVQLLLVMAQVQLFLLPALMRPVYRRFGVFAGAQ